jgi:hypothetical protein
MLKKAVRCKNGIEAKRYTKASTKPSQIRKKHQQTQIFQDQSGLNS